MESRFARIGRRYPRLVTTETQTPARSLRRYRVTGAVIAVLSALGFIGWLLAR